MKKKQKKKKSKKISPSNFLKDLLTIITIIYTTLLIVDLVKNF